jgi:hypothetical protein
MSDSFANTPDELAVTDPRRLRRFVLAQAGSYALSAAVILGTIGFLALKANELVATQAELSTTQRQLAQAKADLLPTQQALAQAKAELDRLRPQVDALQHQVDAANQNLAKLNEQIAQSASYTRFLRPIDLGQAKVFFGTMGAGPANLLTELLEFQAKGVAFDIDNRGNTLCVPTGSVKCLGGFNSPGFASLVLSQQMPPRALNLLPPTDNPGNGDILTYEGGLEMFYFPSTGVAPPFVIGMTSIGIASLDPNFAKRTGAFATGISLQR